MRTLVAMATYSFNRLITGKVEIGNFYCLIGDNRILFLQKCLLNSSPLLKGTATLKMSMFYMKELYETWILIPVSSKLVEKYGSYGCLNICKWTLMEAAIL